MMRSCIYEMTCAGVAAVLELQKSAQQRWQLQLRTRHHDNLAKVPVRDD